MTSSSNKNRRDAMHDSPVILWGNHLSIKMRPVTAKPPQLSWNVCYTSCSHQAILLAIAFAGWRGRYRQKPAIMPATVSRIWILFFSLIARLCRSRIAEETLKTKSILLDNCSRLILKDPAPLTKLSLVSPRCSVLAPGPGWTTAGLGRLVGFRSCQYSQGSVEAIDGHA